MCWNVRWNAKRTWRPALVASLWRSLWPPYITTSSFPIINVRANAERLDWTFRIVVLHVLFCDLFQWTMPRMPLRVQPVTCSLTQKTRWCSKTCSIIASTGNSGDSRKGTFSLGLWVKLIFMWCFQDIGTSGSSCCDCDHEEENKDSHRRKCSRSEHLYSLGL